MFKECNENNSSPQIYNVLILNPIPINVFLSHLHIFTVIVLLYTYCTEHVAYISCSVYTHSEDANKCWGLGRSERLESACRIQPRPFTHSEKPLQKSPNNQQQLPRLRQSSPGINKPSNSSHTRAATCRPVNWTEITHSAGAAKVQSLGTASFPQDPKSLSGLWCDSLPSTTRV